MNILYLLRLGAIGVVFTFASLVMMPVFLIRFGDQRNNVMFCNLILFLLPRLIGVRFIVDRSEAVYDEQNVVLIANHQSGLDLLSCGSVLPACSASLVKRSLVKVPLWGQLLYLGGNILVDRSSPAARTQAVERLDQVVGAGRVSLVIFPEGTRNPSNTLRRFRLGAFRCAMRTGVKVQPMVISTYAGNIDLRRWNAGTVSVKVLPAVEIPQLDEAKLEPLATHIMQQMQDEIRKLDRSIAS